MATEDTAGTDPPLSWATTHPVVGTKQISQWLTLAGTCPWCGSTRVSANCQEVSLWTTQLRVLFWEAVGSAVASGKFGLQSLLGFPYGK